MKKVIVALLALTLNYAIAQTETKTLLGNKNVNLENYGVFAGAGLQGGRIYDQNTLFYNLRFGVVINEAWSVGGTFGQTTNEISAVLKSNNQLTNFREIDFYYYGAFVEYRVKPNNLFHLSFPLNLGVFETDFDTDAFDDDFNDNYENDYQFFVEPGVNVELNLHKFARLYAGASYRIQAARLASSDFPPAPTNHLMFNVGIKLGVFNFSQIKKKP